MQSEWFEAWFDSHYYHMLYQHRSQEEASGFADKIVSCLSAQPGDTLLDLACGKGRHALAFAAHQLDVTGVDLSSQSIAYARQFENDHLHFFVHDMRLLFRTNYFNFVCNLFTSFGYFTRIADNHLAAMSIAAALKPGGKFLIDFVNRSHAIRNIESKRHEEIQRQQVSFVIDRSYTDQQLLKQIKINDGEKHLQFTERVNSFSLQEMTDLFQQTGLTLIERFGDYDLSLYHEDESPRMILIFQK